MPAATLRQLLEAGVHFGHQTSRWNPRMRPYIFTARNGIHIIDLEQTQKQLDVACDYLRKVVADGQKVLFVGTKKQAQDVIEEVCRNTGQAYVTHRWMGGMLTNFTVIQRRLRRLAELRVMQSKGDFERMSGKEANDAKDDLERLENNFAGMADMKRVPGAVFVIDCKKEHIAVNEANKLGIPIVAIVDTNCDPDDIQVVIPGNDDAMRSCRLIVTAIGQAITEGLQQLSEREMLERQEAEKREREAAAAAEAAAVSPPRPPPLTQRTPTRSRPRPLPQRPPAQKPPRPPGRGCRPRCGGEGLMADVTAAMVKTLRERTGAGMMDCKRALVESDGDMDKAEDWLRAKGFSRAQAKAGRGTNEGIVDAYIHQAGGIAKQGALIELNCETDFVAKTDDFKHLAHTLALQVVGAAPTVRAPRGRARGRRGTRARCVSRTGQRQACEHRREDSDGQARCLLCSDLPARAAVDQGRQEKGW